MTPPLGLDPAHELPPPPRHSPHPDSFQPYTFLPTNSGSNAAGSPTDLTDQQGSSSEWWEAALGPGAVGGEDDGSGASDSWI